MNKISRCAPSSPPSFRQAGAFAIVCAGFSFLTGNSLFANPVPQNLGNGLGALVERSQQLHRSGSIGVGKSPVPATTANPVAEKAERIASNAFWDAQKRVLVRVQPNGVVALAQLQKNAAAAVPSLSIQATDPSYHGAGVFEAFVSVDEVPALASLEGIAAVHLSLKPIYSRGHRLAAKARAQSQPRETLNYISPVFDNGVTQHRVDKINQTYNPAAPLDFEGRGISVGVLSDSFGSQVDNPPNAEEDVENGDLPGPGNDINSQPVVVLQDEPPNFSSDEGRAMAQTVYKMAPKARLAFATAETGEVGFANNIRALAGFPQFTYPDDIQQGFKADVITDDVFYPDEPFFQDGIVAKAVDEVVAAGISYFSSAGNDLGINGYDADFRFVDNGLGLTAATNTALAGTNINLANVPAALYAGGFHDFVGGTAGVSPQVAQLVNFPNANTLSYEYGLNTVPVVLQWNDPFDSTVPTYDPSAFFTNSGTITYNPDTQQTDASSFQLALTGGQECYLVATPAAGPTTLGLQPLDAVVTVYDSNGTVLLQTDNNSIGQAEYVFFSPPTTGVYTVTITGFEDLVHGKFADGSFTLNAYHANGTARITQDLNLLVFDQAGNYLSAASATDNNIAANLPIEFTQFAAPGGDSQVQFVIARSNKQPTSGRAANHFRYLCIGDGIAPLGPAHTFNYLSPTTFGHSCAAGANGVAAYPFSRPSLPESFTSPGPAMIYFDPDNNPLPQPQVRQKPDLAAMDGANTSFFGSDVPEDLDGYFNFFGTSDAAPHAAAIAALVLEAHGGSGTVTPSQMKSVLQRSAFPHDLDPFSSTGVASTTDGGTVTVTVHSDNEAGLNHTTGSQDANSFGITYQGPGSLTSFVFNPSGQLSTAGNTTGGQNGLDADQAYFSNPTPGVIFGEGKPFTVNPATTSMPLNRHGAVTATSENVITATLPLSAEGRFFTLDLKFTPGAFKAGNQMHFTIGRYEYMSANVKTTGGTSVADRTADLLGGGVTLPEGTIQNDGMSFSGTTYSGATFSGTIRNNLGKGYSPLDGYGFLNAQDAVTLPLQ